MVNCKICRAILHGMVVLNFGLITAIKSKNERILVECTPEDNGTFYPHPDCNKYYECALGQLFTRDCGPGTYFNLELNECDFQYNVPECEGGTRAPGTSPQPSSSTTTGVSLTTASPISISTIVTPTITSAQTTTNITKETDSTTPSPNSNWRLTEGQVKIQYPGSCNFYYVCIDGDPHVTNCVDGLYFNPFTKECDLPENVNCKVNSTAIANLTEAIDILLACPSNPFIYLPHPTKSSKYYLCEYGALKALLSCSYNYKFDFVLQACEIPGDTES